MNLTKNLGYLGLIGTILVGIGEFYLHFSSNVLTAEGSFNFFEYVPIENLKIGHFLSIIGIPFYFAGYLHVYKMLNFGNEFLARIVLSLGFIAFAVGGVWIGSRGFMGSLVHLKNEIPTETYSKIIENYEYYLEVLVSALRIIITILSIFFVITILKGGTLYTKKMAFFNPITILLIFVFLGISFPFVGKYFLPILMNITHFVIFSISLYQLKTYHKNDQKNN